MKTCPVCGYEDKPSERQINRRLKKLFDDMPIREMMRRRWIATVDFSEPTAMRDVRDELMHFINVKTVEELAEEFDLSVTDLAAL